MSFNVHVRRVLSVSVVAIVVLAASAIARPAAAGADAPTVSVDTLRTAWDPNEPALTQTSVRSSDFGQIFAAHLDGQIYAQPIVIGSMLVVATENDQIYGLDASTGAVSWQRDLGPAWPVSTIGCGDLVPNIGVTSTPVYDPVSKAVYVTTKVNDGADVDHPHWYLHSLDLASGAERAGWPVKIAGSPQNDPTSPFDPENQMQRPGLLLMNGVVYIAFGSHCDVEPYRGYVVGVSTTSASMTAMWTTDPATSSMGAGIWQGGGGLASDSAGRIFLTTGNGLSPPPGPGSAPPLSLAESAVRLQVGSTGTLSAADFFSPSDAPTLDLNDTDLGSGGPLLLPPVFGAGTAHPKLMVVMGKDGRVFLLDRDNLGGRSQGPNLSDAVVGVTGPYQGEWGHPSAYGGEGGYVYEIGSGGPLRALKYGVTGAGTPALFEAGTSVDTFGYTSGSPVVTSDGTTPGSAVVWAEQAPGPTGAGARLVAHLAVPGTGGVLQQIWSAPIGTAAKFAVPMTDHGRVYVGTRDGALLAFGRPAATAVTAAPATFASTPVGDTSNATVTITAQRALVLNSVQTAAPFRVTPPALPASLAAGQTLSLPVSFTPTAPGSTTGTLSLITDQGTVGVSLTGTGTRTGLAATPSGLTFDSQPTGSQRTLNLQITNTGTQSETVVSTSPTGGSFTTSGLPAVGDVITPGNNVIVSVVYAPTSPGPETSSLTVTSSAGALTVPITGSAVSGQGHLTVTPSTLAFGTVAVGAAKTASFTLDNTGNLPVTVTKAKAPSGDFVSATPLAEGLTIQPGQLVFQQVTYQPAAAHASLGTYAIGADDGFGDRSVTLTGNGTTGQALTASPTPVAFGSVATYASSTRTVTLTNNGPLTEVVRSVTAPPAPFSATLPAVGLSIAPGQAVAVPVLFAPTGATASTATFGVTTGGGRATVALTGTGILHRLAGFADSSWVLNGTARRSGNTVVLTASGQRASAGDVVNRTVVSPLGLRATFGERISGTGTAGANGLGLVLLDPRYATYRSLGGAGGALGIGGIAATAITVQTYPANGIRSSNYATVVAARRGTGGLTRLAATTAIPLLRNATHVVTVSISPAGTIVVSVDGHLVMSVHVTLPPHVLVAFSGASGWLTDTHVVGSPTISYLRS
ncbi:MAG TPA: choice-of-anchor D domain-containing protein [Jatrophihabitans sp.]|uniref:choice-of-anchor D domain-containing protein n=1 Tax=Jatrophihabitans sp. TaxID=1932789 RepID=UPI002E09B6D7|nr:choice-of-anchor D domain-containing protein [Jatrophihabitans sp.]